jgi:hypothetical protein
MTPGNLVRLDKAYSEVAVGTVVRSLDDHTVAVIVSPADVCVAARVSKKWAKKHPDTEAHLPDHYELFVIDDYREYLVFHLADDRYFLGWEDM